ncbi:MAG: YIEGIA domain-containing protein [Clostridium sp.]|uniref:YIEGIA domain-containing protein n=1 Tax=Clostridium sp. TaxID=1506 RepID=UPI0029122C6C|nr:YIEGIA domain-containing protein [Clostridium sp.]MDU7337766.1 YIEGIA domain-containing protein [Clostridium sp.]
MPIFSEMISITYAWAIGLGILVGTIARAITLVVDYRQTPTYPDGQFIHLFAGFIAAALGAVAIPALLEKDYAAFTFLALAVQHFRDIRKMEQESLDNLESSGFARRGNAYIDGISKTYEARNYISMISSMITSSVVLLTDTFSRTYSIVASVILGLLSVFLLKRLTKGKSIGDICEVKQGKIHIEGGSILFVDEVYVTGAAGSPVATDLLLNQGLAVVLTPKKEQFRATLENAGQRQAILFEAASALGVKTYHYIKRSIEHDKMVIAMVPVDRDMGRMIAAIKSTPVLENSRKVRRIMSR